MNEAEDEDLTLLTSAEPPVQHRIEDPVPFMMFDEKTQRARYFIALRSRVPDGAGREIEVSAEAYRDVLATLQLSIRNEFVEFMDRLELDEIASWLNDMCRTEIVAR